MPSCLRLIILGTKRLYSEWSDADKIVCVTFVPDATKAVSVSLRLYPDDVGIGAGTARVVCAYSVVIIRVRHQAGNVSTSDIPNVQIFVA